MAKITTLDDISKLLKYVTITLPPFITKNESSYIRQFISSICEVFKINIDQLNQMFNNTFISQAQDGDLDKLILDMLNISRKDGETDTNYRTRALKYAFQYNASKNQINEIVFDTLGYYPIKLTENSIRSGYWGEENLPLEEQIEGTAYYYDDIENYAVYWGANSEPDAPNWLTQIDAIDKNFVGIIHLLERPSQDKLNELCDTIERVRKKGTKIYLQFLDDIDQILAPSVTVVEENAISYRWTLVPSANFYEVQIDTDPLFGSPTTYITTNTNYNFTGLSSGVTYYTRVRYTNTDGDTFSDWTAPTESTTPSTIGTPIATEETNVDSYGFTANWGSVSGATSYLLTIAEDSALTIPISGFNELEVGNIISYNIINGTEYYSTLYYGVKATDGVNTSPYSNIITVNKSILQDFQKDSYTTAFYKFNNSYVDETINNNDAVGINSPTFTTALLSGDTASVQLDGVNDLIQLPNTVSSTRDITIRMVLSFNSFTRTYIKLYEEWYGESASINYVAKIQFDYNKASNRFELSLFDETYSASNNTKTFGFYGNINLSTSTKYYIAFSWDNTTKTALLKVNNTTITLTDAPLIPPSSITQATLNLQDSISPKPIYFGGFTYPNVPYTNNSPHCTLARLAVDSVARDNTYLTQDWTNISSRL